MKYPLDNQGIDDIVRDISLHHRAQATLIADLAELLRTAMQCVDEEDAEKNPWLDDANQLLTTLSKRKIDFENHRFNQKNGHFTKVNSPYPPTQFETVGPIDPHKENELNATEKTFGEEMSEAELATHFKESPPVKKKEKKKKLSKMSLEEIEDLERAQDNSNDIYKISARIKNLARFSVKANLTPQGDMLANSFTHLIKVFYDFAETIQDKDVRVRLLQLTRKQEEVPANLISALSSGMRAPT